jgi:hypothetical protein
MCQTGKHHNHFERKKATVEELLEGDVINFEHFKEINTVKKLMIDYITNDGKSCLPRSGFEQMKINEVLTIYRKLKGK